MRQKLLFYVVAAWEDDFTRRVLDYGAWPDQGKGYFTQRDAKRTLARATPKAGLEKLAEDPPACEAFGTEEITGRQVGVV